MKKILLSAAAAVLAFGAYAGAEGTYTVKKYSSHYISSNYKFSNGETYTSEDEDFETWSVQVVKNGEAYEVENLMGWSYDEEEEGGTVTSYKEIISATWDEAESVLTLGEFTDSYTQYGIAGGLGKYTLTAQAIMDTCDQYYSYVPEWDITPVSFKLEGNELVMQTPMLIYEKFTDYEGYLGYAYCVYDEGMTLENESSKVMVVESAGNAPLKYYNLQGVEISNPANGQIVIVREGNKATKTIF